MVNNINFFLLFVWLCTLVTFYVIEAKVICHKTSVICSLLEGSQSFPLRRDWEDHSRKINKSSPIRVSLPPPNFYFLPIKSLFCPHHRPYCYLQRNIKVWKKVIKILRNKMNQLSACSLSINSKKKGW